MREIYHIRYSNRVMAFLLFLLALNLFLCWHSDHGREEKDDRQEYIEGYGEYVSGVIRQAGDGYAITPFTIENNEHIAKEYQKLTDITLQSGNDQPIIRLVNNSTERVLSLAAVILVACLIAREHRKGLAGMLYGTAGGRARLGLRRIALIWLAAAASRFVSMTAVLIEAIADTGTGVGWERSVQSVEMFRDCTYAVSIAGYLVRYWMLTSMAVAVIGTVVWIVFSLFSNTVISLFLLLCAGGAEYYWMGNLTIQSNLRFLRYINVLQYLRTDDYLLRYQDIAWFGHAVNLLLAMKLGLLVLSVVFVTAGIVIAGKNISIGTRRWRNRGFFGGWFYSLFLAEIYKLLVVMKGFIILALAIVGILLVMRPKTMSYTEVEQYVNRFLEEYRGPVTERTLGAVAEAHAYVDETSASYEEAYDLYMQGTLDELKFLKVDYEYQQSQNVAKALEIIESRLEYIETIREERGIDAVLMNDTGYLMLFTENGRVARYEILSVCIVVSLFMALGSVICERQGKRNLLLSTTARGRKDLFHRKQACVAVVTLVLTVVLNVIYVVYLGRQYGLPEPRAAVQSLEPLAGYPLKVSMVVYWFLLLARRLVVYILIAEAALMVFQRSLIGGWSEDETGGKRTHKKVWTKAGNP